MSDQSYAAFCQRSYTGTPDYGTADGPRAFVAQVHGRTAFCFPGSRSMQDWAIDLLALPADEIEADGVVDLGPLHAGFLLRARRCLALIETDIRKASDYVLCGHSLGGAIALLIGAIMVAEGGRAPAEIVTFGAPRAGFDGYSRALRSVAVRQYRFGADPVPLVPTHPYVHAREPLLQVGTPIRTIDLFANHHIVNYIGALP